MRQDTHKIRVAVCDDEPADLVKIQDMVLDYDRGGMLSVDTFTSSRSLLTRCFPANSRPYDIILLDIEMAEPDGFDTAKLLRSGREDSEPPLVIFITKSSAYTIRGYGIAFRYLNKPVDQEILEEALDAAVSRIRAERLTLDIKDSMLSIPIRDILYVESSGHYVIIHSIDHGENHAGIPNTVTENKTQMKSLKGSGNEPDKKEYSQEYTQKEYRVRMPMKRIFSLLPHRLFLSPHASFLVNATFINRVTATDVFLTDGTVVPLSRNHKAEFNAKLNAFLGR